MDQIHINDLRARGIIGINDWERENPQDMVINITLFLDLRQPGVTDELGDSPSYSAVAKRVLARAQSAERFTIEALAHDLARLCLEDPAIQKARVRVEKPGAIRFARSAAVEIERTRADL